MRSRRMAGRVLWSGLLVLAGCGGGGQDWVLPDPSVAKGWFGEEAEATVNGNVLEIRGSMDPDHLRRGGRIWARSGPYFYLFNVHVQQLMHDYPDLAAVRAVTVDARGEEVARAMLRSSRLSTVNWNEALARSSLAQREGTENPRTLERLIAFGEEHTEFAYRDGD